jgi:exodeoxyribonuclease VII large subunit
MIDRHTHRLWRGLSAGVLRGDRRLALVLARVDKAGPPARLPLLAEHLKPVEARLRSITRNLLVHGRAALTLRMEAIAACHPEHVLRRGYSITRDARTRELIRSVRQVRARARIVTQVADGEFRATADDPRQPELFD